MIPLPWDLEFTADLAPGLAATLEFDALEQTLKVRVTNSTDAPARIGDAVLRAPFQQGLAGGAVWIEGSTMTDPALIHRFGEPNESEGTYPGGWQSTDGDLVRFTSHGVVAIELSRPADRVLLIGALDQRRFNVGLEVGTDADEADGHEIALVVHTETTELAPGESLDLPPLWIASGDEAIPLFEQYAEAAGLLAGARSGPPALTGWCSWPAFRDGVSEADIMTSLDALVQLEPRVDIVQIDDGYQSAVGDWLTPNERFPGGMAALAARIRDAGFRAGMWLAPLVFHEDSRVLAEHPEFALQSRDGDAVRVDTPLGRCAVLDCTHPGAEAWLRDLIDTIVHDWGYSYLKLDHLAIGNVSSDMAAYHRPGTTGPANLRRGLEIILEAAGDEAFILAGNCDFGPAIGVVDAMRVGPDVGSTWLDGAEPSVAKAMRMALQRNWMHRRWWVNDPGWLLARQADSGLTDAEGRFLATAIGLAGGQVMLGDDMSSLPTDQTEVARALMPSAGVAARPLDATGPVPSVWRTELGEGRALLAILNWSDARVWASPTPWLRPGETAFNFWEERLATGDVLLEPHDAALWQVSAPGRGPRVIGDTGHIAMHGLYIRQVSGQVHVRNDASWPRVVAVDVKGTVQFAELAPGELARFW